MKGAVVKMFCKIRHPVLLSILPMLICTMMLSSCDPAEKQNESAIGGSGTVSSATDVGSGVSSDEEITVGGIHLPEDKW